MSDETTWTPVASTYSPDGTDLLDESLRRLPLSERLRGIPASADLGRMRIGVRMRNILDRERLETYGDIAPMSVNDLLALRGAGLGSVRELLEGVQMAAHSFSPADIELRLEPEVVPDAAWRSEVLADLETLARWHRVLGSEDVSVFTVPEGVSEPGAVTAARASILALAASDLLPDVEDGGAAAAAVELVIAELADRELAVLRDRVMADDPASLDVLGKQHAVTRERIRQIETKLIASLNERMKEGDLHALATIAAGAIGSLVGLRALVQRYPTLGEYVPSIKQPVWRFLDRLDPAYEIKDGWCASGTVAEAVVRTRSALTRLAGGRAFVELAAIDEPDLESSTEWLEYCRVTLLRGCAMLGRAGLVDRAEVILHTQQEQMSADDLVEASGIDRSVRSLRNQLAEDARFSRVDRDDWALTAWGLTGYLPIRAMIGRSLSAAGGEMTADELIADITSRFDVSPSSIITYAAAFPYITAKGVVRRRARRDMRRQRRKGLAQTRGLYRHDDSVKLRFVVNSEHLRGSGSTVPNAIGEEIDLSVSEAKTLTRATGEGTILVSWRGPQIVLGSVRAEIEKLGLTAGDFAFFVFRTNGGFDVEPIGEALSAESRVLAFSGDPSGDPEGVWATLAGRIDSTADDRDAIIAALLARGDAQLVELAGAHEMYSTG